MSSESDDPKQPDEPTAAPAAEPDPSERVALKVSDLPDPPAERTPADPVVAKPISPVVEPLPELPAASPPSPSESGSIDVAMSSPDMPASASGSVASPGSAGARSTAEGSAESIDVALSGTAIPQAAPAADSRPVSVSAGVVASVATANEGTGPVRRAKRVTASIGDALSGGVSALGVGIETVGEGVAKIGDATKKVPLVGAGIESLGESLAKAGESITALPQVAKTRSGRLLIRSVVVGFLLVFTWITVIVWFQLRSHDTPDFRPEAEHILVEMGKGPASIAQVYEHASPRFQELVKKERFLDQMMDLYATNGRFREITAINETLVTTGPTGRVGRVGLTAAFERGISKGSISFHWDRGQWKLLGLGIEVPENVPITQAERQKRVAACIDDEGKDVSDQRRKCDVRDAAETILEMIRDGHAGDVWDGANDIFKQQESRQRFIQIQDETRASLGNYKRLLNVTDARAIGGITATFDIVAEFERSSGVRVEFDFTRPSKFERWRLARFKVTVPMPRPNELPPEASASPVDAGAGSASGT